MFCLNLEKWIGVVGLPERHGLVPFMNWISARKNSANSKKALIHIHAHFFSDSGRKLPACFSAVKKCIGPFPHDRDSIGRNEQVDEIIK